MEDLKAKTPEGAVGGSLSTEIPFDEFQKLDLRIGKIVEAAQIPGSRNLIKMMIDFGTEKRQAVAGLLKWYKPEDLVGKKCAFILNLQHRVMMGVESQCMIFAAEDEAGNVVVLQPEKDIAEGSKIR
ncbi:MAG TPA: methionine--tRNA ligase subunit beta [Candidatus Bathyarchaeia archaeon]|nr:methionine--tRNA ligase subunit beta [Candidatus Bathyarchaeia archaeon]